MAAGVALLESRLEEFELKFEEVLSLQSHIKLESLIDAEWSDAASIEKVLPFLEPLGQGNPSPRIRVKGFKVKRVNIMKEVHLKVQGEINGHECSVLQFQSPWVRLMSGLVGEGFEADFICELLENEWQGKKRVELKLSELLEVRGSGKKIHPASIEDEALQSKGL